MLSRSRILFILSILLLGLAIPRALSTAHPHWGNDFYNFWHVSQEIKKDSGFKLYDPEAGQSMAENALASYQSHEVRPEILRVAQFRKTIGPQLTGTPLLYSFMSLFDFADFPSDFRRYQVFAVLIYLVAIMLMGRELGFSFGGSLFASSVLLLVFAPIGWDLAVGNIGGVQLLGVVLLSFCIRRRRFGLAGFIAGFEILLKPNFIFVPTLALAFLMFSREERTGLRSFVAGAFASAAGAFVWTGLQFRTLSPWGEWLTSALPVLLKRADYETKWTNFSPLQMVYETVPVNQLVLGAVFAFGWIFLIFILAVKGRKESGSARELRCLAIGALGVLLIPKVAWYHYQVLAIPALAVLWSNPLAVFAGIVLCIDPLWWGGYSHVATNLAAQGCILFLLIRRLRGLDIPCADFDFFRFIPVKR